MFLFHGCRGSLDKKPADCLGPRGVRARPWEVKERPLVSQVIPAFVSSGLGAQWYIIRNSGDNTVYLFKRKKTAQETKPPGARSSTVHNSQDLKAVWMPISGSVDRDAAPVLNGVLLS